MYNALGLSAISPQSESSNTIIEVVQKKKKKHEHKNKFYYNLFYIFSLELSQQGKYSRETKHKLR